MNRMIWVLPALLCLLVMRNANAGELAPELAEHWSKLPATENVNAIFHLWDRVDLRELDITLRNMHATRQLRHQIVVEELQRVARETQPALLAELESLKSRGEIVGYTPYWITNCVVVQGPRETLEQLASHASISMVIGVPVPELIEPVARNDRQPRQTLDDRTSGVNAIRAPEVWYELGFTGEGTLIGGMDTGVDGNHVALASRYRGVTEPASECWMDVLGGGTTFPTDNNSHGTHTMGTMCGTGSASSNVDTVGVAPGARWIAMNAIGGFGGDFDSDVLTGYQWFADPDGDPTTIDDVPDVIQNSWGVYSGLGYPDCFEDWNAAIIACETAGTVVTFSAGNEGPGPSSHRSPANIAIDTVTFFSVGAVNANSFPNAPYPIVGFSSRGPSDCDGITIKPEVLAPGENVYSCMPGGSFGEMSGTSMAGPHVAGVVALMREANPNADVREIKSVLMQTAIDYDAVGEDNNAGHGFIDAYEAVLLISADRGWVFGQVTNSTNGQPISGARVQAGANYIRYSDVQGNYRISLPADSLLPFTVTAFGYAAYNTNMSVADSDTVFVDIELTPVASGTVNGTVLIAGDIPVQGATITPQDIPVGPLQTNASGQFSYSLPGNNTYSFEITFQDITLDTSFTIDVGETVNALIRLNTPHAQANGPDDYGYRAYERYDFGLPAQYVWANMNGSTELDMPAIDNVSAFIEMPFPFVYYGASYDSLTINENGWVAPGEDPDRRSGNTPIPNPAGPAGMLALYWDDLDLSASPAARIRTKYDAAGGVFVIEYDHVNFSLADAEYLTAQIHIFDQEVWPTPTGDCEIMFVYDHIGLYGAATVGIENPAENDGLQLRQNANIDPATFELEQGAAVFFSTRQNARTNGHLTGVVTVHPTLTGSVTNGVRLGNSLANVLADGSFSFQNVFAGPRTLRVQMAGYENALATVTIQTNQTANVNAEVWRLDPPRNLMYWRTNDSLFMSWEAPASVGGLDELQEYVVHLDSFELARTTAPAFNTRIPSGENGHRYWLTAWYDGGESTPTDTIEVTWLGAEDPSTIPTVYALAPAYPNPFNPTTSLEVSLPQNAKLALRVYDIMGREVETIANGSYQAGVHHFNWNAARYATGVYFARIESPLGTQMQKLLLLK